MNYKRNQPRFVVLGANTPWVYALTEALAQKYPATAIRVYDWRTFQRNKVQWPATQAPSRLVREMWLYPPGFLGAFRALFSRVMARRLKKALAGAAGDAPQNTWLIAPYPWLAPPEIPVKWPNLVYYNLDDYGIYRARRAGSIYAQERQTMESARLIICLAQRQVERFRQKFPGQAQIIRHFPLGVCEDLISPLRGVEIKPNTVAYVGGLGDRVDWQLVLTVAKGMPDVDFVFMGDTEDIAGGGNRVEWMRHREESFKLPNVSRLPKVAQSEVKKLYWPSAINWIPYDIDHPFNMAACPTKIMDGLASGRPLVSARVPECLLYPDWLPTFEGAGEAQALIKKFLAMVADGTWQPRAEAQLEFVRQQLWSERASTLLQWVEELDRSGFDEKNSSIQDAGCELEPIARNYYS